MYMYIHTYIHIHNTLCERGITHTLLPLLLCSSKKEYQTEVIDEIKYLINKIFRAFPVYVLFC